jgi:DNA-damage-inducible protein J
MSQAQFSFWLNSDVKEQFESVCNQIGIDTTMAFNEFVVNVVRDKRLPFEPKDSFYSESNMAFIRRGIAALNNGKGVEHELIEVDE